MAAMSAFQGVLRALPGAWAAPVGEHAAGSMRHGAVGGREVALHAVAQDLLVRGVHRAVQLVRVCAAQQVAARKTAPEPHKLM